MSSAQSLLEVRSLMKNFPVRGGLLSRIVGQVQAVSGVSFHLKRGETLGLVGESGCGKSTLGRCILRLLEPSDGKIFFGGKDVTSLDRRELRTMRRRMQIIFQDPYGSLNPRMTVEEILVEPLEVHRLAGNPQDKREKILNLLDLCGLRKESLGRYPHEFSGGQRQRIAIARALAVQPDFIVCDEPVSALDVSIQAQIINLMRELQQRLGLTYLFISHDLKIVRYLCDEVAVMYLGKIVEIGPVREIYENPKHPYTQALLSAIPVHDRAESRSRIVLKGDVPSALNPPSGCHFHPRCPVARPDCAARVPELRPVEGREVSCHYA